MEEGGNACFPRFFAHGRLLLFFLLHLAFFFFFAHGHLFFVFVFFCIFFFVDKNVVDSPIKRGAPAKWSVFC